MEKRRVMQYLTGTRDFIEELRRRTFRSPESILQTVANEDFTPEYLINNGFSNPILFPESDGLNMRTPKFRGWANLEQYIGGERMVEVIDVEKQDYCLISFASMMKYMRKPSRTKILNLISLECSETGLGKLIQPPSVACELDWVTKYWTNKKVGNDSSDYIPKVQKYCLVSPVNAYTDFHIDFGGTSVWYHVVKGAKVFYLIRPTFDNMNLYKNWLDSVNRLRTFFADQVDDCYKVTLLPGNTLFLPTGWIHAVLTIEDSLVFGGNFLHSLNMQGQLAVYALEAKTKTPERLLYPHFEEMHWRVARGLSIELEEMNSKSIAAPSYLLNGLKAVLSCLKQWSTPSRTFVSSKEKNFIIKSLSRNIKIAERILITINPPKPERGSTRPRKKRILEDFIDYPTSAPRKKLVRKPKQSLDYPNENSLNEKWHVQNGGTKVVFRKLKNFSRKLGSNSVPDFLVNKDLHNFENSEVNSFRDVDQNTVVSSDSEDFSEEIWGSNQPSSSNQITQDYGRHLKIIYPSHSASECDVSEEIINPDIDNKETVVTNESVSPPVVVHQDDEYIYPSLLLSDDEVQGYRMSSKDKDMPWNPKAKVGNVMPRTDRPSRIGKQKVAVEKGLEEAASVIDPSSQRPKDARKKNIDKNGGFKGFINPIPSPRISRSPLKGRRRYTTVKQRLSKILKLHRRQR